MRNKKIKRKNKIFSFKGLRFWALSLFVFFIFFGVLFDAYSFAEYEGEIGQEGLDNLSGFVIYENNSFAPISSPNDPPLKIVKEIPMIVTAYSSTPSQTDDTPYVTASGVWVREGIVANNLFPFGTLIRIPEIFNDKIFVVQDRMHWTKGYNMIDVWLPDYNQALAFGAQRTYIEVLE